MVEYISIDGYLYCKDEVCNNPNAQGQLSEMCTHKGLLAIPHECDVYP